MLHIFSSLPFSTLQYQEYAIVKNDLHQVHGRLYLKYNNYICSFIPIYYIFFLFTSIWIVASCARVYNSFWTHSLCSQVNVSSQKFLLLLQFTKISQGVQPNFIVFKMSANGSSLIKDNIVCPNGSFSNKNRLPLKFLLTSSLLYNVI